MTKPITTKPNPKAAWTKELRAGQEGSAWRMGVEIIDDNMKIARKTLDRVALPYAACDLVRLATVAFKASAPVEDIAALAKARLDCESLPYTASDLIEMIALFAEGLDFMMDEEAEHMEVCADCAGQARH